jgi:hypothetical protein
MIVKFKSSVYDYFGAKLSTPNAPFLFYSSVSESQVLCHLSVNSVTNLSLSAHTYLSLSAHRSLRFLQWINVDKPGRENGHRLDHPPPYPSQQRQTSLFRDAAPVDTIINYSATICVINILSNLLFTVLHSYLAVHSESLTLSLNKPRRTDLHILQGS